MADRVPYQLIDLGTEADILTWDLSGEPTVVSLALGDFAYRDATGALVTVGTGALVGQGLVADGLGNWAVGNVLASGGSGGAFTAIQTGAEIIPLDK